MSNTVDMHFLPKHDQRKYYADHYSCKPLPIFMILVTLVELTSFIYYTLDSLGFDDPNGSNSISTDSLFIYRPDRRYQIWRFVSYMVLHAGYAHLLFNLLVQVLVGLPLEMVHGSFRVGLIYLAGVLAGSLGTSVFDPECMLVGASGGVYALLAAHLANVVLNYHQMELGFLRVIGVFLIGTSDIGFALYDRSFAVVDASGPVSYVAHLSGVFGGLCVGLIVLKNFEKKVHKTLLAWMAAGLYSAFMIFAIVYNLFN